MKIWLCLSSVVSIFIVSCSTSDKEVEEVVKAVSPPEQVETPLGMVVEPYPFPYDRLPASQMSGSLNMNLGVCKGRSLNKEQKEYCGKMGRFFVRPEGGVGDIQSYFIWDRNQKCYSSSFRGVQKTADRLMNDNNSPIFQGPARPIRPDFSRNRLDSAIHGSISICFKDLMPISLAIYIENPLRNNSGPYGLPGQVPTSGFSMKAEGKEFSIQ